MPDEDEKIAGALARIEGHLARQGESVPPTKSSAAAGVRAAIRENDEAARAVREAGGGVADQNAARSGANR